MRSARRVATLVVTVGCTAILAVLAPAAHAAPPAERGSECVMYNDEVVYCIHYR